jgi:tripartite-type tricarboxylate transporter receptor subunit TctC
MKKLLFTAAISVASLFSATAFAGPYPDQPIKLIVPYSPGGMGSQFGNLVADAVSPLLGQRIVVDYRPGANGSLGANMVAKSPPDGYTLLMAVNSTMAINPHLYPSTPYDPVKDFAPVGMVFSNANVLLVNSSSHVKSVKDLIALAKAQPGKLSFGSSGNGATPHLSGEMFKRLANVNVVHVPYKGIGPALTDLMGGQVDFVFGDTSALGHVASGRLRALAVTSPKRLSVAPDLPTMEEAGVKGMAITSWYSLVAPAGTPKEIIDRVNRELTKAMRTPEMQARMMKMGVEPAEDMTPQYLENTIRTDLAKWKKFIGESGIRME